MGKKQTIFENNNNKIKVSLFVIQKLNQFCSVLYIYWIWSVLPFMDQSNNKNPWNTITYIPLNKNMQINVQRFTYLIFQAEYKNKICQ